MYRAGELVAVRVSASADCYAGRDPGRRRGKGVHRILVRAPVPELRAGREGRPNSGPGVRGRGRVGAPAERRGSGGGAAELGAGFPAASPAAYTGGAGVSAGAAWSAAVTQASALSGAPAKWQRYEWSVATASFGTRPPDRVASGRRGHERAAAQERPAPPKAAPPAAGDVSTVPRVGAIGCAAGAVREAAVKARPRCGQAGRPCSGFPKDGHAPGQVRHPSATRRRLARRYPPPAESQV